jgi:hypothetical protein
MTADVTDCGTWTAPFRCGWFDDDRVTWPRNPQACKKGLMLAALPFQAALARDVCRPVFESLDLAAFLR